MKRRLFLVTVLVLTVVVVASWARQQMAVESRDQAVTEDDLRILQRADLLLKDASVRNRHDDRDRQTEMVIRALRQFTLPHLLMDFNNLPETRFEDVKQVLRVATERVGARLNSSSQQGHLPPNKRLPPSGR